MKFVAILMRNMQNNTVKENNLKKAHIAIN
jgi:hypothetical protein